MQNYIGFIRYVTIVIDKYNNENFTINKLVKVTRSKRLQYEKNPFNSI